MMTDSDFMQLALREAEQALALGEVPIGAVVVWDGEVVATAHNLRETEKNAMGHAECLAIERACKVLGGWRLHRATLYVTLEPCAMCAGAIVNARIKRVCYGAADSKAGAFGSVLDLNAYPLNHKPEIVPNICEEDCSALLSRFFEKIRQDRIEGRAVRHKKSDFM